MLDNIDIIFMINLFVIFSINVSALKQGIKGISGSQFDKLHFGVVISTFVRKLSDSQPNWLQQRNIMIYI